MRKFGVAMVAACALAGMTTASAGAAVYTGPCAIQQNLFQKENIQIDMHQQQVEDAYRAVCAVTG